MLFAPLSNANAGFTPLSLFNPILYAFFLSIHNQALLSIVFYYFFGLNGLGYAVVVDFLLYYFVISLFNKNRYGYLIDRGIIMLLVKSFGAVLLLFVMSQYLSELYFYISGGILLVATSVYCLMILKRRLSL